MWRFWLPLAVISTVSLTMGCEQCQGPSSPLLRDAAAAPNFTTEFIPKDKDAAMTDSLLWEQAARTHDAIDLGSLADRQGAAGLLEGLERGGDTGRTALLALPYAKHAPLAYRRLAEIALQTTAKTQLEVLGVIEQIALTHRVTMEPLDPAGTVLCANALKEISTKASVPEINKNAALSTTRLSPFLEILRQVPASAPSDSTEK